MKIRIKGWIYWLKIIVGVLLLVVIYQKINRQESVLTVLSGTNLASILICATLVIPHFSIAFFKWRYLLRIGFPDISNREIFGSLLFGISLGAVTPGNIGELGRGLFFQNKNKIIITGLTVIDKLANMLVITTLGFIAISLFILNQLKWDNGLAAVTIIPGALLLLSLWIILMKKGWMRWLFQKVEKIFPKNPNLRAFMAAFKYLKYRDVLVVLGLTFSWLFIITLQYYVLILGFTDINLGESIQATMAALFTKMLLPFTVGGLGIREGATVFYFSLFNVSRAAAFNTSLIIFLINFLVPGIVGFYYVLRSNGHARKAKSLSLKDLEPDLPGVGQPQQNKT